MIAYIESSYQLKNFIRYCNEISGKKKNIKVYLRINGSSEQCKQYDNILIGRDEFLVKRVNLSDGFFENFKVFFCFIYDIMRCKTLVVGDARSFVSSKIIKNFSFFKKIVLVDDGLYLYSYWRKIKKYKVTLYSSLYQIEFDISKDKNNSLSFQYMQFDKVKVNYAEEVGICFIGSKVVEIGYLNEEFYLSILRSKYCNNIKCLYFAHRGEAPEKLKKVSEIGYILIKPDLPLEDYFIINGAPKAEYFSLYSTALYNLSVMIPDVKFSCIDPGQASWLLGDLEAIYECYDLLEKNGISRIYQD
ncbi:hypothetical protein [Marinomonas ostreistagni]|uniref:hypothetical protein n=1 Tax=Marinomonas ostreistagni TaxID=359209 RepID=UPI00194EA56C|nr:hypothetical protein [Marinomonas ostreistagni]MBM6551057.1 hypothetical protein [Marinomonas ostreistagni]